MIETRADVDVAGYPAFRESVWVRLIETGHAVSGPILGVRPAPHCNRADQLRLRPREGEVDCLPALAVERHSYEQRPVIGHEINPTVGRDLVALGVTPMGPTRAPNDSAPPTHDTQPPDSQFHVIYDIATTFKLRRRHFRRR